jgi:hypothetical protein
MTAKLGECRLEAELDEHLRHGTLRLPPVADTGNVRGE